MWNISNTSLFNILLLSCVFPLYCLQFIIHLHQQFHLGKSHTQRKHFPAPFRALKTHIHCKKFLTLQNLHIDLAQLFTCSENVVEKAVGLEIVHQVG